jgi:hypothetical protein
VEAGNMNVGGYNKIGREISALGLACQADRRVSLVRSNQRRGQITIEYFLFLAITIVIFLYVFGQSGKVQKGTKAFVDNVASSTVQLLYY